jgi:hypothetical protein
VLCFSVFEHLHQYEQGLGEVALAALVFPSRPRRARDHRLYRQGRRSAIRVIRTCRVRIQQRKYDQIETIAGILNSAACVIQHHLNTWLAIRVFEMKLTAQLQNQRIDFHRRNPAGAVAQSSCHIVPSACA